MRVSSRFSDVRLAGVALLSKRAQGGTGKRIEGVKRGVLGLKSRARRCCFVVLALALAGCASLPDTFDVGPFLREQITGDSFRACLARTYQAEARAQVRAGRKWALATTFAAKGQDAFIGRWSAPVLPASPSPQLAESYAAAQAPLRTADTCACANAQARLDAWALREAARQEFDVAAVKTRADEAIAACAASR